MLSIIKHINNVNLSFSENKVIAELPRLHPANQRITLDVPLDIPFNEYWTVHHDCHCGQTISFSPVQNWNPISCLFTRFYSKKALKTIAKAFKSLKIFETPKSPYIYLTDTKFYNLQANVLQIPHIQFNYYQCEHCCSEYLCQVYEGLPSRPSREFHDGDNGRLFIPEIVQIEWKGEASLLDYLEGEYTEPEI